MYREPFVTTLEEDFSRLSGQPLMPPAPVQEQAPPQAQVPTQPIRRAPLRVVPPAAPAAPVQEKIQVQHTAHGVKKVTVHTDAASKAANRARRHTAGYRAQQRKAGTATAQHRRKILAKKKTAKWGSQRSSVAPAPASTRVQETRAPAPAPARPTVPAAQSRVASAQRLQQEAQRLQQEATAIDSQRPMRCFANVALIADNLQERFSRLARKTNDLALNEQAEDLAAVSRVAQDYAKKLNKAAPLTPQMREDFNSMIAAVSEGMELHDELKAQYAASADPKGQ